tara:strand:- start:384 stop:674 length:291 start_codon:yes stop_codon:yes gene_type:complete
MNRESEIDKFERVFRNYSDRELNSLLGKEPTLKSRLIKAISSNPLSKKASFLETLLFSPVPGSVMGLEIARENERRRREARRAALIQAIRERGYRG